MSNKRAIGDVRPSQLITTFGPGAIVDLQTLSVIVAGIDESGFEKRHVDERNRIKELADRVTRIDHYRALGLKPGAETDQVEKAFSVIRKRPNGWTNPTSSINERI